LPNLLTGINFLEKRKEADIFGRLTHWGFSGKGGKNLFSIQNFFCMVPAHGSQ
jgi:hypothetical protein